MIGDFAALTRNAILAGLPSAEVKALLPSLSRVRLVSGQSLIERGRLAEHAFFIADGLTIMLMPVEAGVQDRARSVQVAMIGRNGMVGGLAALEERAVAISDVLVQIPGFAYRIATADLREAFEGCPELQAACNRFVRNLTGQIMENAASYASSSLLERCMRWLITVHPLVDGDDIPITHEALASLLGVRRAGVTVAAATLQKAGLIATRRGFIRVVDAPGLRAALGRLDELDSRESA